MFIYDPLSIIGTTLRAMTVVVLIALTAGMFYLGTSIRDESQPAQQPAQQYQSQSVESAIVAITQLRADMLMLTRADLALCRADYGLGVDYALGQLGCQ